jgi:hypothetical protein
MTRSSSWGRTPRESVAEECARRGKDDVVAGCIDLINGFDADAELIVALGGPPAGWAVTGEAPGPRYWLRVWGLRGLLWAWDDAALSSLESALSDEAWRVREMALKVVARHRLEDMLANVVRLRADRSARVRAAASRAEVRLTAGAG